MQTAATNDFRFAAPDDIMICLPLKKAGGNFFVRLEGGISVRMYIRLSRYLSEPGGIDALRDIAYSIIREDPAHRDMTPDYFTQNFDQIKILRALVVRVVEAVNDIINDSDLTRPIVQIRSHAQNIHSETIKQSGIMQDITYLCAKTAHTYDDVMRMPYVTFITMLKNLTHLEALKDPDYLERYKDQQ